MAGTVHGGIPRSPIDSTTINSATFSSIMSRNKKEPHVIVLIIGLSLSLSHDGESSGHVTLRKWSQCHHHRRWAIRHCNGLQVEV